MLFWVTTRGRERILINPRDSAAVSRISRRYVAPILNSERPLVGPVAPRFENNGIEALVTGVGCPGVMTGAFTPGLVKYGGGKTYPGCSGLFPMAGAPLAEKTLLPHPNPTWVPISRAKLRVAATTRASISTSGVLRSSLPRSSSIFGITLGMSSIINALVRSSETTSPRDDRNFLMVGTTSLEWA